jgi:Tfp pilus assembly protein PilO
MSGNDRMILLFVSVVAAVAAFWFMALSPKQHEASDLGSQVTQLQDEVSKQQQAALAGQQARKQFPRDYHRLVVMGKAVPVDDDTASLIVQINRIAEHSGISFMAIDLNGGSSTSTAAAPATSAPSTSGSASSSDSSSTTASAPPAAPATESSAASLPIGATVGSAGLPTLPYSLTFRGTYFEIADFMAGIDALVKTGKGRIQSDGRLVTIDSFTLAPFSSGAAGTLSATLSVTTYLTPADQGLTASATPSGPAAVSTAPASSTSSAPATP